MFSEIQPREKPFRDEKINGYWLVKWHVAEKIV
jgi:hypothetical protein